MNGALMTTRPGEAVMRLTRPINRWAFTAIAFAAAFSAPCNAQTLLVRNVRGYTPTSSGIELFSSLLIVDGRVRQVHAGNDLEVAADVDVIDGGGKTLLPGLIDAHGHVLALGEEQNQVDLRGSSSVQEALRRIAAFAKDNPGDAWLRGRGWNQVLWAGGAFPTAKDLDTVSSTRPALLSRVDGHAVWINSRALQLAGITRATPDPAGGQILHDADGEPTGVLVDTATRLIERHLPQADDQTVKRALQSSMRELIKVGLTGVHDAGIDARQYRLYQQLGNSGELPLRIYAMLADSPEARRLIVNGPRAPQFDDRLQLRAVKALVDGALGSRGAALLADYDDQPHQRGLMLYTPQQLQQLARLTAARGWQLNLHAIGDAGNRMALDTFAAMYTAAQRGALRPRIEHAQVVTLEDIPRFAALGVIASIQPTHATSDMNMAEARIGAERMKGAYAWRKLKRAGARLAGGSDFPVELPDPFHGLYAAVTRQDRDGQPPGGWYGGEKLNREEALRLFTIDAAYAGHMEHSVGSLEPGKWADFVLIDRDYFAIPEPEIDAIRVLATYVAGRKVSESEAATSRSSQTVLAAAQLHGRTR
jgi:predicted amidohydrolase YtcJ